MFKSFKPPPLVLPRVTGEDEGWGVNGAERLNGLNILNGCYLDFGTGTAGIDIDLNETSGSSR